MLALKSTTRALVTAAAVVLAALPLRADIILYATEREFNKLVTVNLTTNTVADFHLTGLNPDSLLLAPSGKFIYDLAPSLVSELRSFDPATNIDELLAGPAQGISSPQDLALDPTNTYVLVANFGGASITKTTLASPHVTTNVITNFQRPEGMAFDGTGKFYAVGGGFGGESQVFEIRFSDGAILRQSAKFDPTNSLDGLVYDPFTNKLYVTSQLGNALYSIDIASPTLAQTFEGTVPAPDGVITDSHGLLYIASRTFFVYEFNITSKAMTQKTPVPGLDDLGVIANRPPVVTKTFDQPSIFQNGTVKMTIKIQNENANDVTGAAFTDTLPNGLVVTSTQSVNATCGAGSVFTAFAAATSVSLTGGVIPAASGNPLVPGSCTFVVTLTGTIPSLQKQNCVFVTTANSGTSNTSCALIDVLTPTLPIILKTFAAPTVVLNGTTALTFVITNPSTTASVTVNFTDTLPAGLVVATPPGVVGTCAGVAPTAAAGGTTVTLPNATLPASGSCTFSVNVTGTTEGLKHNCVTIQSSLGAGNQSCADLPVLKPPTIAKSFLPVEIDLNASSKLTFTITNTNAIPPPLNGIAFTDTLPAGLEVSNPNGLTGNCDGGIISAVAGSATVSLGGATLDPGASCTFSINVKGTTAGLKHNSVMVTSTNGGPGNTATADLTVRPGPIPPTILKAFGAVSLANGATTTLTFTLSNPNTFGLTGVQFSDTFPPGLIVATPNGLTNNTCTPPATITAVPGSGSVALTGGTLAAGGSCTFTVNVTAVGAVGTLVNTTSNVLSNEAPPGDPATAVLIVGDSSALNYFPNLNLADSVINITNVGALGAGFGSGTSAAVTGAFCANVFTFSPDEQLVSCCSCPVTPNGLVSLSVVNDLISNTLTPARPTSVVVKLLATVPVGGTCSGSAATVATATIAPGLAAWGTKVHASGATAAGPLGMTEVPFLRGTLSTGDLNRLGSLCGFIIGNGSGFGICNSCRLGGLGGAGR